MLTHWTKEDGNWLLLKVPRASDFVDNATPALWHPSGAYVQPEMAWDVLNDLRKVNREKLEAIPVDMSLYGKYNVAGLHDVYDAPY